VARICGSLVGAGVAEWGPRRALYEAEVERVRADGHVMVRYTADHARAVVRPAALVATKVRTRPRT
jgi:hypothetical protein